MKTSVEWLREYTDVNVDIKTLADRLAMTGSKVETIEQRGNNIKNFGKRVFYECPNLQSEELKLLLLLL